MAQAGVFPWSRPMPHDHSTINLGGAVPIGSISGHLKALHDAMLINADLVDGIHLPETIANVLTDHDKAVHDALALLSGFIDLGPPSKLTIAGGQITISKSYHCVETQGGSGSDDLVTINGTATGRIVILEAFHDAHTINITAGGNIRAGGGFLDTLFDKIAFVWDAGSNKWCSVLYRSN